MAKIYGNYNADFANNPPGNAHPFQEARTRRVANVFDLSKQPAITTADQLVIGRGQKGWAYRNSTVMVDTSLGTSTIAIGTAATPAKYRAAAVATGVNTPSPSVSAVAAGAFEPLAQDEELIITVGVASLPAAGKIYVELEFLIA